MGDARKGGWPCLRASFHCIRSARCPPTRCGGHRLQQAGITRNGAQPRGMQVANEPLSQARVGMVGERPYDLGNRLYECMLDSRMTCTGGYLSLR